MTSSIICEIIKLTIDRPAFWPRASPSNTFADARKAATASGAKAQYYGENIDEETMLFWIIGISWMTGWSHKFDKSFLVWDKERGVCDLTTFRDAVKALDQNGAPQSWLIIFSDESILAPAVTAPITELVSNPS